MSDSLRPHELQHARLPCPSLSPSVCSNSCPWSQWCYLTISPSAAHFSSCPQSFPASESFPKSQFFASVGQSIETATSASALPVDIQGWFPLGSHALEQMSLRATAKVCAWQRKILRDPTKTWHSQTNKQKRNEKTKTKTNLDLIRKGFIQKDYCKGRKEQKEIFFFFNNSRFKYLGYLNHLF